MCNRSSHKRRGSRYRPRSLRSEKHGAAKGQDSRQEGREIDCARCTGDAFSASLAVWRKWKYERNGTRKNPGCAVAARVPAFLARKFFNAFITAPSFCSRSIELPGPGVVATKAPPGEPERCEPPRLSHREPADAADAFATAFRCSAHLFEVSLSPR